MSDASYNVENVGLGTIPYDPGKRREEHLYSFKSADIMAACFCGVKLENGNLYVLRKANNDGSLSAKFIQKEKGNNSELIANFYQKYFTVISPMTAARYICTNEMCKIKHRKRQNCQFLFGKISDLVQDVEHDLEHAKQHFSELIVLACKEDVFDIDNTYILESRIIQSGGRSDFEIYLFNKRIVPTEVCCSEWIVELESPSENPNVSNKHDQEDAVFSTASDDLKDKISSFIACVESKCDLLSNDLMNYRIDWNKRKESYDASTEEHSESVQHISEIEKLFTSISEWRKKLVFFDNSDEETLNFRRQLYMEKEDSISRSVVKHRRK